MIHSKRFLTISTFQISQIFFPLKYILYFIFKSGFIAKILGSSFQCYHYYYSIIILWHYCLDGVM